MTAATWCAFVSLSLAGCGARTALVVHADTGDERDGGSPRDASPPMDAPRLVDSESHDADYEDGIEPPGDAEGVAAALSGLRWEMPCELLTGHPALCVGPMDTLVATHISGEPGAQYDVLLWFRGVAELKTIDGGTTEGTWNVGGTPVDDSWNLYTLEIGSPPLVAHVNAGIESYCDEIDLRHVVRMEAGTSVTLRALSVDHVQARNLSTMVVPIVVDGIPPAPLPYDGQFIQMDVLSVTRAR